MLTIGTLFLLALVGFVLIRAATVSASRGPRAKTIGDLAVCVASGPSETTSWGA